MSLPLWSKHDEQVYRALSLFPQEQEGKLLDVDEFRSYFKDFRGRPIQDIIEALDHYGRQGYFKYEIKLAVKYLKHNQGLSQVETALRALQPEPETPPTALHGLSESVQAKAVAERALAKAEASNLPDEAKHYLLFILSDVDRTRLREEWAIYNQDPLQPSRLVKNIDAPKLPALNLKDVILTPDSYDDRNGVLHLAPFHKRMIAGKSGAKRPNSKKYAQCWMLECLFKSDRTLLNGVEMATILGVSKSKLSNNYNLKKKIQNVVAEVNKKVATDGGPKKLISINGSKVKVEQSYL